LGGIDGIQLGKVDCVEETSLYWENDITGYPTIKVYVFGEPVVYEGARELNDIVEFVKDMAASGTLDIDGVDGGVTGFINALITPSIPVVIAFIDNNEPSGKLAKKALDLACKRVGRMACGVTSDLSGLVQFSDAAPGPMPLFTMVKPFTGPFEEKSVIAPFGARATDDIRSESVSSLAAKIAAWMRDNSYPVVTDFTSQNQDLLFSRDRPGFNIHVILMDNGRRESLNAFGAVARRHLGKCVFIHLDASNPEGEELIPIVMKDLEVDTHSMPQIMIVRSAKTQVEFYNHQATGGGPFGDEEVEDLLDNFFSSRLSPTRVVNAPKD
jgi:hypothetical protein